MLYFFKKLEKLLQHWGLRLQIPVGLLRLGAPPQTPKLFFSLHLRVTILLITAQIPRHR